MVLKIENQRQQQSEGAAVSVCVCEPQVPLLTNIDPKGTHYSPQWVSLGSDSLVYKIVRVPCPGVGDSSQRSVCKAKAHEITAMPELQSDSFSYGLPFGFLIKT